MSEKITIFMESIIADKPNKNGRIYPRHLLEKEVKRLKSDIKNRKFLGYPFEITNAHRSLMDASHVITDLDLSSDGQFIVQIETLDTPNGKLLKDLIESNKDIEMRVSGLSSTDSNQQVRDDFHIKSFDICINGHQSSSHLNRIF